MKDCDIVDAGNISVAAMTSASWDSSTEEEEKDFLPSIIQGWLLLQRCGLDWPERKDILASAHNSLRRIDILRALEMQWPDYELLERDKEHEGAPGLTAHDPKHSSYKKVTFRTK